ncbi:hypothetical protein [Nostoc sp. ChiQUE01b]|uniref:hypothetical protein n=1 Tax=Nostoc sp. ChiQUE01b TaxID=3075376 RepID=UPI002AD436AC|nr:hypothetical protein [Nostoc sp. ChiQUE01b]MDZ8263791.1 hypothetical protein [Nostoc sp. ChiQUE01b]
MIENDNPKSDLGKFYLKSNTIWGVTSTVLPGDRRDMANNSQFDNLPQIKLIPLNDEAVCMEQRTPRDRPTKIAAPTDIRLVKVLEFLRSNNLAPNSRKLYERELKRFLGWTQLHYHERKLTGHQSDEAFRRYTLRSEQQAAIAAYYRAIGEEEEE